MQTAHCVTLCVDFNVRYLRLCAVRTTGRVTFRVYFDVRHWCLCVVQTCTFQRVGRIVIRRSGKYATFFNRPNRKCLCLSFLFSYNLLHPAGVVALFIVHGNIVSKTPTKQLPCRFRFVLSHELGDIVFICV